VRHVSRMTTFRIALANVRFPANPDDSVRRAAQAIAQAGERRAGVVCFPECYVPGYRAQGKGVPAPDAAFLDAAWSTIADAAKRELLEETGYAAERIEILTTGPASSGLTSEVVTLLLASGLKRVQAGGGVGHENITVHEVPLSEAHDWLAAKASEGLLIEPKVYAGLYFIGRTP